MYNSHNIRRKKEQRNKTKAMWWSQEKKGIKQENLENIKMNMARKRTWQGILMTIYVTLYCGVYFDILFLN